MTNNSEQLSLINEQAKADDESVVCLGRIFKNEEARREYFRQELRKKLPELKQIEGFPFGNDEDIIALSDPPYYTACPNPWITDFIEEWEKEKEDIKYENYEKEPFISDVMDGKTDPLYLAHSYHTKVPHKAIMKYILHYTNPGDIVFDGFCGTGTTGIAAQLCGNKNEVEKLGYTVSDNKIYDLDNKLISELGIRRTVIGDLSPAATFIASNMNLKRDFEMLFTEINELVRQVESKYNFLYETTHTNGEKGIVNYTLWSDIFICSTCSNEFTYWDTAINTETLILEKELNCPHCKAILKKRNLKRLFTTEWDSTLQKNINIAKQKPVLINYIYKKKKYFKKLDSNDESLISKIENMEISSEFPSNKLPMGFNTKQPINSHGFTHAHHFYTKRNLIILSDLWGKSQQNPLLKFALTSLLVKTGSKLHNVGFKNGKINLAGALPNVLFVPSISAERNILILLVGKIRDIYNANLNRLSVSNLITTNAFDGLPFEKKETFDYIFIDPPFGSNLMYSELNFLWEAWHKVFTDNKSEAIENPNQGKSIETYGSLMKQSLQKAFLLLKQNRWITIEFSNTSAKVWNIIQQAVQDAGFIIASVSTLNKGQGTYYAQTNPTSVQQDLIISAYKPNNDLKEAFKYSEDKRELPWIFIQNHLSNLGSPIVTKGEINIIIERTPRILFDRMIAYHVQNGLPVPLSSAEFQIGLSQRFPMRDGMFFLDSQVAEYDKKRTLIKEFSQMSLFVSDENSAIEWIRQQLMKKPQTRQDLHSQFMKEIQHIARHEQLPELDDLLVQNFLRYEDDMVVPDQIAGYLRRNYREYRGLDNDDEKLREKSKNFWYVPDPNKQADLEKLREKTLLREFEGYVEQLGTHKKKLSHFRTEAIRAGFRKAWTEKDYIKIVNVGDRLPETVIQEDDKLLMYYDNAQIRVDM